MVRWSVLAALATGFTLALAPTALAQGQPYISFEHDDSLDGTPNEIVSGFYPGDDGVDSNGDVLADRYANTFEVFEFQLPDGVTAGSFNVNITWNDPRIDLDLYVYRRRPPSLGGGIVPTNIANSASFGDNTEDATYTPTIVGEPVEDDTYVIVVDNWCSRDEDDDPTTDETDNPATPEEEGEANCGIGEEVPDEDDFVGLVTFAPLLPQNNLPRIDSFSGPSTGRTGQLLTYTAQATDPGGFITSYTFDLDGDGYFERAAPGNSATTAFTRAGTYSVGVRAVDNSGDAAYASQTVTITGPPVSPSVVAASLRPLQSFKLSGPVFGGRRGRSLGIRFRLRERANVNVSLYRGKKRIRRLTSGAKRANRTYRLRVKPRRLKRGRYTVRIFVRAASGKVQRARLTSKRL